MDGGPSLIFFSGDKLYFVQKSAESNFLPEKHGIECLSFPTRRLTFLFWLGLPIPEGVTRPFPPQDPTKCLLYFLQFFFWYPVTNAPVGRLNKRLWGGPLILNVNVKFVYRTQHPRHGECEHPPPPIGATPPPRRQLGGG